MKYYVLADVHGFYSPMKAALEENGFFEDTEPHKVILCGDMLDRGKEAEKTVQFFSELQDKGELIFVRGNHEDLMLEMLANWKFEGDDIRHGWSYHNSNGTYDSALALAKMGKDASVERGQDFVNRVRSSDFVKKLIPHSANFYETQNYIFVHGWIPCRIDDKPPYHQRNVEYQYLPDWRNAPDALWDKARWVPGWNLWEADIKDPNKTIVCGHWHCSAPNFYIHNKGEDEASVFEPFVDDGIICLDACTAYSKIVNCIVIEDEEI